MDARRAPTPPHPPPPPSQVTRDVLPVLSPAAMAQEALRKAAAAAAGAAEGAAEGYAAGVASRVARDTVMREQARFVSVTIIPAPNHIPNSDHIDQMST